MGVGRFAYTPLLPLMQRDFGFGDDTAGLLASVHYAGYLMGALLVRYAPTGRVRTLAFRLSLLVSIATTAGMGLTSSLDAWWVIRFVSGLASAGVFVLSSAIIMDALAKLGKLHFSGYVYSGVGAGIAMTGLVVPALDMSLGVNGAWLGLAALCIPLAVWSWRWVMDQEPLHANQVLPSPLNDSQKSPYLIWLTIAYFCEGLGFIVSGTFLVSIIQNLSGSLPSANRTWILVGIAAAPSGIIWSYLAKRIGLVKALIAGHLLQALGIVLPVISYNIFIAYLSALLFGGTFIGIAVISLSLAKTLAPMQSGRIIGLLTAVYGTGQIIGPTIAGFLAEKTNSFSLPLTAASIVVAIGAVFLTIGSRLCTSLRLQPP
jgi:MFS family permease